MNFIVPFSWECHQPNWLSHRSTHFPLFDDFAVLQLFLFIDPQRKTIELKFLFVAHILSISSLIALNFPWITGSRSQICDKRCYAWRMRKSYSPGACATAGFFGRLPSHSFEQWSPLGKLHIEVVIEMNMVVPGLFLVTRELEMMMISISNSFSWGPEDHTIYRFVGS